MSITLAAGPKMPSPGGGCGRRVGPTAHMKCSVWERKRRVQLGLDFLWKESVCLYSLQKIRQIQVGLSSGKIDECKGRVC